MLSDNHNKIKCALPFWYLNCKLSQCQSIKYKYDKRNVHASVLGLLTLPFTNKLFLQSCQKKYLVYPFKIRHEKNLFLIILNCIVLNEFITASECARWARIFSQKCNNFIHFGSKMWIIILWWKVELKFLLLNITLNVKPILLMIIMSCGTHMVI